MAFSDGDFIEVEYSAFDAAGNSLIETTDEKAAKDAGIYNERARYGRKLIILGFNRTIKGLDLALRKMAVGQQQKFTFGPDEAFGQRSDDYVKVMRLADMRERGVDPYPGMRVDLDGIMATVRSVNSGRVTIDANHPYAGHEIIYEVKVVGNPRTDDEKARSLSHAYGVEPTAMKLQSGTLSVAYGPERKKDEAYFVDKAGFVAAVLETMKDVTGVNVEEQYRREKKEGDEAEAGKRHQTADASSPENPGNR